PTEPFFVDILGMLVKAHQIIHIVSVHGMHRIVVLVEKYLSSSIRLSSRKQPIRHVNHLRCFTKKLTEFSRKLVEHVLSRAFFAVFHTEHAIHLVVVLFSNSQLSMPDPCRQIIDCFRPKFLQSCSEQQLYWL
ncbi:hypothetical protein PMAYCL1PPCAC_09494, partial [Pristionchus mayeri]